MRCPECGKSFEEIRRSLLVGCENCYAVFANELFAVINKVQAGNLIHNGKTPYGGNDLFKERERLINLRKAAEKENDYDKIVEIMDKIKKINEKISKSK